MQLIAVLAHEQEYASHLFMREIDSIAGVEPFRNFALFDLFARNAVGVNNGIPEVTHVAPKIADDVDIQNFSRFVIWLGRRR